MLSQYPNIKRLISSGIVQSLATPSSLQKIDDLLKAENIQSVQDLSNLYEAIGKSLTVEQQLFVSANWKKLVPFLNSEEGQIAIQQFVTDWSQVQGAKND